MKIRWLIASLILASTCVVVICVTLLLPNATRSLSAPLILDFEPNQARDVAPSSPLTVTFNTSMDRGSVEKSFLIEPVAVGSFKWSGNSVAFVPSGPGLKRGTDYKVTVGTGAKSILQKPLDSPYSLGFSTAGDLVPVSFQPVPEAVDVAVDNAITVAFNRPVVAVTAADNPPTLMPIDISPAIEGKGQWISSSVFRFRPNSELLPSTDYQVSVKKDVVDTTGGKIAGDATWKFSTVRPAVTSFTPTLGSRFVIPGDPLLVEFNQPMDRTSVQQRFSLTSGGQNVPGTYVWSNDSIVEFRPTGGLRPDASFTGRLAAGLKGAAGPLASSQEITWTFASVGPPRLSLQSSANIAAPIPPEGSSISLRFTAPMSRSLVTKNLSILPEPTQVFSSWQDSDTRLDLFFPLQPSSSYSISVGNEARDRSGRALTGSTSVSFTTGPRTPAISLRKQQISATTLAGYPFVAGIDAVNVTGADLSLFRLTLAEFLQRDARAGGPLPGPLPPDRLVTRAVLSTSAPLNQSQLLTATLSTPDGPLAPGYYLLSVSSGKSSDEEIVVVSKRSVFLKSTPTEYLAWVTDPASGKPVPNVSVQFVDRGGQSLAGAPVKTDADGIARAQRPAANTRPSGGAGVWAVVDEPDGPSVVASSWSDGIAPFDFDLQYSSVSNPYSVAVYTERPIYRPGQTVYFKGIVRKDQDAVLSLPADLGRLVLAVKDPNDRAVLTRTVSLDSYGSISAELPLEEKAPPGYWSVSVREDAAQPRLNTSALFQVAEYRRPEFEVNTRVTNQQIVNGDTVSATVEAKYFFGGQLTGGDVLWRVASAPYIFRGPDTGDLSGYTFGNDEPRPTVVSTGPRQIASGRGTTGSSGTLPISFPADLSLETNSRLFTIESTVTDQSGQAISNRSEVVVHKANLYAGLKTSARVSKAGEKIQFDILSLDPSSKVAPNTALQLDFAARRYYSVQQKTPEGNFIWVTNFEDTPVADGTFTTDGNGKAAAEFTAPKTGLYRLQATGKDSRGNETRSTLLVWVAGSDFANWGFDNNDRFDLVADKATYKVGETAHLLVASPFDRATALLTVEREGIRSTKLIDVKGSAQIVDLPVDADSAPNIFVSIILFTPNSDAGMAAYKLGYAAIKVATDDKILTVEAAPDRDRVRPGDTVTYRLQVKDSAGKGVRAQVSASVVDLAILSLSDSPESDVVDTFYRKRLLGVQTSATLAAAQARLDLASRAAGKGGGGEPGNVRSVFADTAYWNAAIETNDQGQATFQVKLPDNLTTWRLTAKAQTQSSLFGQTTKDIISTKDLLVRPVVPRFLTAGDTVNISAIAQNLTNATVDASVSLEARGMSPTTGKMDPQNVSVAGNGTSLSTWTLRADSSGIASLTFKLTPKASGTPGDSVELRIPIQPIDNPETIASSGDVQLSETEVISLTGPIDPTQGGLDIRISPSLTSGFEDGRKYLDGYEFETIEATISRMTANVAAFKAISATGTVTPGLAARVVRDEDLLVQKLGSQQKQDGGWGWWVTDPSQPYLTAYALIAIADARSIGVTVDTNLVNRASTYLTTYLTRRIAERSKDDASTNVFLLYALARSGRANTGLNGSMYDRRAELGQLGKAQLGLALIVSPTATLDSRVKTLTSDLLSAAVWSATGAHWEETTTSPLIFPSSARATSTAIQFLLKTNPDDPAVSAGIRWLMADRADGHWQSTFDTASALGALTDYVVVTKEGAGEYHYQVLLNGKDIGSQDVRPNGPRPDPITKSVGDLLLNAPNRLEIKRNPLGSSPPAGKLYYSTSLKYYRPGPTVQAKSQGISVAREYLAADGGDASTVSTAKVGDLIRVRLTIIAPTELSYLVIEDPLFAGAEPIDPKLMTSSIFERVISRSNGLSRNVEIHDNKIAFFQRTLAKGTYEVNYYVRVTSAGKFQASPARASQMYQPEVWGRSEGGVFEVK